MNRSLNPKFLFLSIILGLLSLSTSSAVAVDCIGVIPAGVNRFWKAVESGALKAEKELQTEIYYRSPVDETHVEGQRKILELVLRKGCRGVVMAPNTPDHNRDVEALKKRGIPTVFIDRSYGGDSSEGVFQTNNYEAGKLAGREMVKLLKGKGHVIVMRLKKGIVSTTDRETGFIETATAGGLIIYKDEYVGLHVRESRIKIENLLKESLPNVDGIFAPNITTTLSTLTATRKLKIEKRVKVIGFDSSKVLIEGLAKREIAGLVIQRPFQMGYQGVHAIHSILQGKPLAQKFVDTGVTFVTTENMDNPEIRDILYMKK